MDQNPFIKDVEQLPDTIPVFPLSGVLLLPHGQLPLNIFEPRYLAMVEDVLASNRIIGMIQPRAVLAEKDITYTTELYDIGCAGKITEFAETEDGRYRITLTGICRFRVEQEIESNRGYRRVKPEWSEYKGDTAKKRCLGVDREKLMVLLEEYFEAEGMSCDFAKFDGVPDGKLMTCLSMICPFEAREKQALLEKLCCVERAELFMTMLEMAIKGGKGLDKSKIQCH